SKTTAERAEAKGQRRAMTNKLRMQ
ncbi:uncharacterized protein METZ01_LOCUS441701, partial [marine metagenome]